MGNKRKREDDDDEYVDFCSGLQKSSSDGIGNNSYVQSLSRPYKRPKINPNFYTEPKVDYTRVERDESIYREIKKLITNRNFVVDEITKVKNSVLEDAYNFKKNQKMKEYGGDVEEALLFHGTKEANLDSICKFNFDWRLTGRNIGHKFGKGVNFSSNAKYASTYSDPNTDNKVMIVAKVLIGKVCRGHNDMTIPPKGFDTSAKGKNGVVLVKYEDNEFYPAFILRYHFRGKQKQRPQRKHKHCDVQKYSHRPFSYGNNNRDYGYHNNNMDYGNHNNSIRNYGHLMGYANNNNVMYYDNYNNNIMGYGNSNIMNYCSNIMAGYDNNNSNNKNMDYGNNNMYPNSYLNIVNNLVNWLNERYTNVYNFSDYQQTNYEYFSYGNYH